MKTKNFTQTSGQPLGPESDFTVQGLILQAWVQVHIGEIVRALSLKLHCHCGVPSRTFLPISEAAGGGVAYGLQGLRFPKTLCHSFCQTAHSGRYIELQHSP